LGVLPIIHNLLPPLAYGGGGKTKGARLDRE
jgi:hypothetical protein